MLCSDRALVLRHRCALFRVFAASKGRWHFVLDVLAWCQVPSPARTAVSTLHFTYILATEASMFYVCSRLAKPCVHITQSETGEPGVVVISFIGVGRRSETGSVKDSRMLQAETEVETISRLCQMEGSRLHAVNRRRISNAPGAPGDTRTCTIVLLFSPSSQTMSDAG